MEDNSPTKYIFISNVKIWSQPKIYFWVRLPLEEMKYLIFSFLGSGVEAKPSVEFRHSSRKLQI